MKAFLGISVFGILLFQAGVVRGEVYQYYPGSPVYMGGNFDPSKPGQSFPACLNRSPVVSANAPIDGVPPNRAVGVGQFSSFYMKKITSRRDLYSYLSFSASISGGYKFFSADGHYSLESENTFSEDSFTWMIYGYTNFGAYVLKDEVPNVGATTVKNDPVALRQRCGTEYVRMENRAVMAAAVFTIHNLSTSDRKKIEASFSASFDNKAFNVGIDADYKKFTKEAAQYGQVEVNFYALGGPGISSLSGLVRDQDDPAKFREAFSEYFKTLTAANSVSTLFVTASVSSLFAKEGLSAQTYNKTIGDLFLLSEDYGARRIQLMKVKENPSDFGLAGKESAIDNELRRLDIAQDNILAIVGSCGSAYRNVSLSWVAKRTACTYSSAKVSFVSSLPAFTFRPFKVRYWIDDPLAAETYMTVEVYGPSLDQVNLVKNLDKATGKYNVLNPIKVEQLGENSYKASQTFAISTLTPADFPIGIAVRTASGFIDSDVLYFTYPTSPADGSGSASTALSTHLTPATKSLIAPLAPKATAVRLPPALRSAEVKKILKSLRSSGRRLAHEESLEPALQSK